jgi:hypothetical protein
VSSTTSRRQIFVYAPPGTAPIDADELTSAATLLAEDERATCLVIEHLGTRSRDHTEELGWADVVDRVSQLELLLRLRERQDASVEKSMSGVVHLSEERRLQVVAIASSRRLVYVRAAFVSNLGEDVSEPSLADTESFRVAILRKLQKPLYEVSADAADEAFRLSLQESSVGFINSELEVLSVAAGDAICTVDSGQVRTLITRLFETRRWLRQAATVATVIGDEALLQKIEVAVGDVDALGSLLSSTLLGDLFSLSETEAKNRAQQEARQRQLAERQSAAAHGREQRLARYIAALVLPTLWLTFWAAKPAPEWKGAGAIVLVLGGCLPIACLGYVLAAVFYRGIKTHDEGGEK